MQKSDYQNHLNSIASYSWLASITFVLTSLFYSFAFLPALEYALLCSYPTPVSGNTSRSSIQQLITNPSIIINALFVTYVIVTLCWILTLDIYSLPELVFSLFFNGTYVRSCLLLFWIVCFTASILYVIIVNKTARDNVRYHASTVQRKFFHITVTLVAVSGLLYDPPFVTFWAHMSLQTFIIIELLRSLDIKPWSNALNTHLLIFLDSQDSIQLILTPILLLAGVFLPMLMSNPKDEMAALEPYYYSGILGVGVGDGFAAVFGSLFGHHPWPHLIPFSKLTRNSLRSPRKTIEGSVAMFASQFFVAWSMIGLPVFNLPFIIFATTTTILEAQLSRFDNIMIPIVGMWIFSYFE